MNTDPEELIELIHACLVGRATEQQVCRLNERLRPDAAARDLYLQLADAHSCLAVDESLWVDSIGSASAPDFHVHAGRQRWFSWRPLTAIAAGIVFGTFCTSVVFGLVTQRAAIGKKTPLAVFDPGLESTVPITAHDVPSRVGSWGAKSGRVVTAENGVEPREGQRMLRLEPLPPNKQGKTNLSSAYQMLDLRSRAKAIRGGDAEVQVTASFCAANSEVSSRYAIRIFAIDQPPDKARRRFWQKQDDEGVAIVQQTFGTVPGEAGWHTFSLTMPLPRGARTLVMILAAGVPKDATAEAAMYYLDDVQVSVLTPQPQS